VIIISFMKKFLKFFVISFILFAVSFLLFSGFLNDVMSNKSRVEECFLSSSLEITQNNDFTNQLDKDLLYDTFMKNCEGDVCQISKEEFIESFNTMDEGYGDKEKEEVMEEIKEAVYSSEEYREFNKVFENTKISLPWVMVVSIIWILVSLGVLYLINKEVLKSLYEFSLFSFLGAFLSAIYFKGFLWIQSFVINKTSLVPSIENNLKETIMNGLRCIFSESLDKYFLISIILAVIFLGAAIAFYFLNRKSPT